MRFSRFSGKPLSLLVARDVARAVIVCALVLCASGTAGAAGDAGVSIVYPPDDAHVPYVEKSFIFGSTTLRNASVAVNGRRAYVNADGAWIAYVPFQPGRFALHVVARDCCTAATAERTVVVDAPPTILPATPATIDPAAPIAPAGAVVVRRGERVDVELKATPNARVSAALGSIARSTLRESAHPRFVPGFAAALLAGQRSAGPLVRGYYHGAIVVPRDAPAGTYAVAIDVAAPDGTHARVRAPGSVTVDASPTAAVGTIAPLHLGEDGVRRYGVIERSPDGEFWFFPPVGSRVRIVGEDGGFTRVALGDGERGWIARRSVDVAGRWTAPARVHSIERRSAADGSLIVFHLSARCVARVDDVVARYGAPAFDVTFYDAASNIATARDDRAGRVEAVVSAGQRALWGYRTYWSGDDFVIDVKRLPALRDPAQPVRGLTIALDPGHEPDPGSTGPLGTREADLNLAIAQRLRARLVARGARVVLTRGAAGAPLYARPATAAAARADLLLSIHGNALPDGVDPFAHHGYSAYWVRPQARAFAQALHDALGRALPIPDAGIFKDDLVLTRATEQPSALVETAFVMWPDEEAMLRDPAWQSRIADALATGIEDFVKATLR